MLYISRNYLHLTARSQGLTDNDMKDETLLGLLSDWGLVGLVIEPEPKAL